MTIRRHLLLAVAAAVLAATTGAWAQGPVVAAMQKWRDEHKLTFQLQNTLTQGLARISQSKATELKPAQAKKLLTVVAGLRKKPKLTQTEAKTSLQAVNKTLDKKQLAAINAALKESQGRDFGGGRPGGPGAGPGRGGPGGGGPGRGGPGGGGGPGAGPGRGGPGGGGPGGARPQFNAAQMKNFNPFNPQPGSFRYENRKRQVTQLETFLKARAAGKPATLELGGGRRGR